jgi:hypothetical protein
MISVREFCPRCQPLQNMEITISQREEIDSEGNSRKIVTKSYHCENCRSTLRSEDIEAVEGVGDSEAEEIEQQATEGETRIDEKHGARPVLSHVDFDACFGLERSLEVRCTRQSRTGGRCSKGECKDA